MSIFSQRSAFTLIELLVVIAIIGLLSSVVLASLSGARESARDAVRKQDLKQIQTAMELYYNDNGFYIKNNNECDNYGWFNRADGGENNSAVGCLVEGGYLPTEIIDPSGNISEVPAYLIESTENHYTIWAALENPSSEDLATQDSCYYSSYDTYDGTENYCVSSD